MAPAAACLGHPYRPRHEQDGEGGGEVPLLEMASAEIEKLRTSFHKDGSGAEGNRDGRGARRTGSQSRGLLTREVACCDGSSSSFAAPGSQLYYRSFPPACLAMLKCIDGNHRCVDCGEHDPQWAAVKYGALLCLQCSGYHRSLGVHVSSVRSISMDEWSLEQVLCMLEGGNNQLAGFFARHALTSETCCSNDGGGGSGSSDEERSSPSPTSVAGGGRERAKRGSKINFENVTRLRYKTKAALFYRQQMELHVKKVLQAGPYRGREISRRLQRHHHHRIDHRGTTLE